MGSHGAILSFIQSLQFCDLPCPPLQFMRDLIQTMLGLLHPLFGTQAFGFLKLEDPLLLPDAFDEQQSVTTYVNIVALAMGIDARELWPNVGGSSSLGTATESQVMHLKARGKGIGDLISTIERVVNWRILPKRVTFSFDNVDSEEDQAKADLEATKIGSIMSMWQPDAVYGPPVPAMQIRQMLSDNVDYYSPEFLEYDLTEDITATDMDRDADK